MKVRVLEVTDRSVDGEEASRSGGLGTVVPDSTSVGHRDVRWWRPKVVARVRGGGADLSSSRRAEVVGSGTGSRRQNLWLW
jgi:hypothetical protein